jgi:hypothetical protein
LPSQRIHAREHLAEAGYEQVYYIGELITRIATPEEIAVCTLVAEHITTGYTATDRPVRVCVDRSK